MTVPTNTPGTGMVELPRAIVEDCRDAFGVIAGSDALTPSGVFKVRMLITRLDAALAEHKGK